MKLNFNLTDIQTNWLQRLALALVYGWFGLLKIFATSPAESLVKDLLAQTMPFIPFPIFLPLLGAAEILLAIVWLVPRATKLAFVLTITHMIMTFGPMVLLPTHTWLGLMQPTLEGQYIIKNVLIIAMVFSLLSQHRKTLKANE